MARHLMLVMSNAKPGRENGFNAWYETHILDVLAHPGFIRAERFRVSSVVKVSTPAHSHAAIYEMECDDPIVAYDELLHMLKSGKARTSDCVAPDMSISFLTPLPIRK